MPNPSEPAADLDVPSADPSGVAPVDLDALQALREAATPGPWVIGDWWRAAGVMPERFGDGRCGLCKRLGEPIWTGRRAINSSEMLAHIHVEPEPFGDGHTIYHYGGDGHPVPVADNYDYEQGGIVDPADAELIVAAVNALPALVAEVRRLRPAPCEMTHTPPYDFAQCDTHDTTFPLGEKCKFDEREMWEVFAEEEHEQRVRAVRAEATIERVQSLVEAHPTDYVMTYALRAALDSRGE